MSVHEPNAAHETLTPEDAWEERGNNIERLVFFSDAVFAIALTLLVLDIRVPEVETAEALVQSLLELWPNILSFLLSFFVIGGFWRSHHRMYTFVRAYDQLLIQLNFLLLLAVVALPFTTSLIGRYGNWSVPTIIYLVNLALVDLMALLLWRYATGSQRIVVPNLDPRLRRLISTRILFTMVMFVVAAIIALFNPIVGEMSLIVLLPLGGRLAQSIYPRPVQHAHLSTTKQQPPAPAKPQSVARSQRSRKR